MQELEERHREEVERVKEAGREAQDQAIDLQAEAWGRERTELIRYEPYGTGVCCLMGIGGLMSSRPHGCSMFH